MGSNVSEWNLKELLVEWKLEDILSHLNEEKIDVEILKIMKISHIRLLLNNFPLGIQILFEHNLEKWRREIGKPLQIHFYHDKSQFKPKEPEKIKPQTSSDIIKIQSESKISQTDLMMFDSNTISTQNTESNIVNNLAPSSETDMPISSKNINTTKPLKIQSHVSLPPTSTCSNDSKPMPYTTKPHGFIPKVDLRKILSAMPYGVELINIYRQHKTFNKIQRKQLIAGIVNYFLDNKIRFSLQISYALERAILKTFPTEKLETYRIAKRGRLYYRYINSKAAMKFLRGENDMIENSDTECGFDNDSFSEDSQMVQNKADSFVSNMNDEDEDYFMVDDEYTVGFIEEDDQSTMTDDLYRPEIKIEPENVSEMTPLPHIEPNMITTAFLFNKKRPDDSDTPFERFVIPWHKVPSDVLSMLENKDKLGKRLNVLANLLVDELRNINTHVPMRIFRYVTQQAVTKYPHSFLDYDSEGNIIASDSIPLLKRMRNRNNFLNR